MADETSQNSIKTQEACSANVESLTTLMPRAFHSGSEFHRKAFPDTPVMRKWWNPIFQDEIRDPKGHVLVALDSQAQDDVLKAVGVLCMRLFEPDEEGAGFWTMYDYTPDHDMALVQAVIDAMVEYRPKIFKGSGIRHYLIEFFGVDRHYQGTGLGSGLLRKACDIADKEGYSMFVEANMNAYKFYEKFGFVKKDAVPVKMPNGQPDFWEYLLVRPGASE